MVQLAGLEYLKPRTGDELFQEGAGVMATIPSGRALRHRHGFSSY
jgi:hypothetical protein